MHLKPQHTTSVKLLAQRWRNTQVARTAPGLKYTIPRWAYSRLKPSELRGREKKQRGGASVWRVRVERARCGLTRNCLRRAFRFRSGRCRWYLYLCRTSSFVAPRRSAKPSAACCSRRSITTNRETSPAPDARSQRSVFPNQLGLQGAGATSANPRSCRAPRTSYGPSQRPPNLCASGRCDLHQTAYDVYCGLSLILCQRTVWRAQCRSKRKRQG